MESSRQLTNDHTDFEQQAGICRESGEVKRTSHIPQKSHCLRSSTYHSHKSLLIDINERFVESMSASMKVVRRLMSSSGGATMTGSSSPVILTRGAGLFGALGIGNALEDQPLLTKVTLPDPLEIPKMVGAGWGHSIAVSESGKAYFWGRPFDFNNILRINRISKASTELARLASKLSNSSLFGNSFGYYPYPVPFDDLVPIDNVSCSAGLTVMVSKAGEIYSYGYNRWEQCGMFNVKRDIIEVPTRLEGFPLCSKVDTGLQHVLALTQTGKVFGWGKCNKGQLGFGETTANNNSPIQIPLPGRIVDISAGFLHGAAVCENGKLYVWGKGMDTNTSIKMGNIQVADIAWLPRSISLPKGLRAVEVVCSSFATAIRANDNSIWMIGMCEHDRNVVIEPLKVASDYIAADGSSVSVFDCVERVCKGQQRVSIHCDRDFVSTTDETEGISRSFDIIMSQGEAFIKSLKLDSEEDGEEKKTAHWHVIDYSSGWKHDLVIARPRN